MPPSGATAHRPTTRVRRPSRPILAASHWRAAQAGAPALIYGAGRQGVTALRELASDVTAVFRPVAFIDSDGFDGGVGDYDFFQFFRRADRHRFGINRFETKIRKKPRKKRYAESKLLRKHRNTATISRISQTRRSTTKLTIGHPSTRYMTDKLTIVMAARQQRCPCFTTMATLPESL